MSVYLVVFGSLPFSAVIEKDGSGTVSDWNISPLNMGKVSRVKSLTKGVEGIAKVDSFATVLHTLKMCQLNRHLNIESIRDDKLTSTQE